MPPVARNAQSAAESAQLRAVGKAAKQNMELLGAAQPAGQVQLVAPLRAENLPAGHGAQVALDVAPVALL